MAYPFNRQSSREALEETTRQFRSSISEGSSKIFGSVMGARKGFMGGLTSTFDQVVNLVGGGADPVEETADNLTDDRTEAGLKSAPKPRPPKPPAPMIRQRSEFDSANGVIKHGPVVSRQNTVPAGYVGVTSSDDLFTSVKSSGIENIAERNEERPRLKRQSTNPFAEDYEPSSVEHDLAATVVSEVQQMVSALYADSKDPKIAPVGQLCSEPVQAWNSNVTPYNVTNSFPESWLDNRHHPGTEFSVSNSTVSESSITENRVATTDLTNPNRITECSGKVPIGDGSDQDSEGTEGCDDDDRTLQDPGTVVDSVNSGSLILQDPSMHGSCAVDREEHMEMDVAEAESADFMKYFVEKIFNPSSEITPNDKARFGELCQNGYGRMWFARCVNGQRVNNKGVCEETFYGLVQYFAVVFFESNEAEDFGPAKTLMNMCFTFYHEVATCKDGTSRQFLYTFLKDQPIWQSPRFWNAAFFYAVQQERASKPIATSDGRREEKRDDLSFQENITFGQLGTFSNNMRAFGLSKEQSLEFIKKQSTIANLPPGQVRMLRENMERWSELSFSNME